MNAEDVDALRRQLLFELRYRAALVFEYDTQAIDAGREWREDQIAHYGETTEKIERLNAAIRAAQPIQTRRRIPYKP